MKSSVIASTLFLLAALSVSSAMPHYQTTAPAGTNNYATPPASYGGKEDSSNGKAPCPPAGPAPGGETTTPPTKPAYTSTPAGGKEDSSNGKAPCPPSGPAPGGETTTPPTKPAYTPTPAGGKEDSSNGKAPCPPSGP
ncbi:hypothetical protein BDF19DRAFT_393059, partial [Syncephalis fuscata]